MDRAETVRLVSRDGRWYVEADGELVGALPARFAVLPAALSLLA